MWDLQAEKKEKKEKDESSPASDKKEGGKDGIVYRNGARDTDLICVSGDLGAAYMGLQLLEREKKVFAGEKDFSPDFGGKEYLLERRLRPEARRDVVDMPAGAGILPTSMIDISDGLSSELLHICHESRVGSRLIGRDGGEVKLIAQGRQM